MEKDLIHTENLLKEAKYSVKQQSSRADFLAKEVTQRKELLDSYVKEQAMIVQGDAISIPKTEDIDALKAQQLEHAQATIQSLNEQLHVQYLFQLMPYSGIKNCRANCKKRI